MSQIIVTDRLNPTCNVRISVLDQWMHEIHRVERHNVFTNMGRNWIRDLISVPTYAFVDQGHSNDRPMYIALGVGGEDQTETPPGGGTYVEEPTVINLELPVQVSSGLYFAQCSAQPNLTNTDFFPDIYTVRFRTILRPNQVSFAEQPTYGTLVPVSEAALFTSACRPLTDPAPGPPGVAVGMIAYAVFPPVYKTSANLLEVIWELQA